MSDSYRGMCYIRLCSTNMLLDKSWYANREQRRKIFEKWKDMCRLNGFKCYIEVRPIIEEDLSHLRFDRRKVIKLNPITKIENPSPKIERLKGSYSNTSPYGLRDEFNL